MLIVGNRRTSTETIERALTIQAGKPLGASELIESQRRLRALGLFTRVTLTDVGEPGEARRDLVVTVEEAPPTSIGYGAGVEGGRYLRQDEVGGPASERLELAARGFFEIGRRNLWGSNRSVNLFTRVSVRPTPRRENVADNTFGFNEYRVLATFREPSVFNTRADGRITGYFEQAVRSSFNFVRRGVQVEMARRLRERLSLAGGWSLSEVRLFDERIAPMDRPDIDRLFPQVRLSKFRAASRLDTRDDVLDPTRGMAFGVAGDLAARAIGSQVGFVKGFSEFFVYRQAPKLHKSVVAAGARVGLSRGFTRTADRVNEDGDPVLGPDGQPIEDEVSDLPASERFFAGGDTTVRGFARDALGDEGTIDRNGFPTGGNAERDLQRRAAHAGVAGRRRRVRRCRQRVPARQRLRSDGAPRHERLRRALQIADWADPGRRRVQARSAGATGNGDRAAIRRALQHRPGILMAILPQPAAATVAIAPAEGVVADCLVAVVSGQPVMASDWRVARALELVPGAATLGDAALIDRLIVRELMRAEVERFSTTLVDVDRGITGRAEAEARTARAGGEAGLAALGLMLGRLLAWIEDDARIDRYMRQRFDASAQPSDDEALTWFRILTSATTSATAGHGRSPRCATKSAPALPGSGGNRSSTTGSPACAAAPSSSWCPPHPSHD